MIRKFTNPRGLVVVTLLSASYVSAAHAQEVSLPFVDAGNVSWERATAAGQEDATGNYIRQGSPEWHQNYMTGRQSNFFGDATRRSWFVFDASAVDDASTAVLRVWGMQATPTSNDFGMYTSDDATEIFVFHSIEHTLPSDVLVADGWGRPSGLEEVELHATINRPIWEDLADGAVLGSREFSEADDVGPGPLLVPTPQSIDLGQTVDCLTDAIAPCGRFYDIPLNQEAVDQINNADGAWMFGGEMPTAIALPVGQGGTQWLFPTHFVDLPEGNHPGFRIPAPQLLVSSEVSVPLFGGGFAGLAGLGLALAGLSFGMARRRGTTI